MSFLSTEEEKTIQDDMKIIIEASGNKAKILRPVVDGQDTFYGSRQKSLFEISTSVACEIVDLSPDDILMKKHNLIMYVLPYIDVNESDVVEFKGDQYKITDLVIHNCFGVATHLELMLKRNRRSGKTN